MQEQRLRADVLGYNATLSTLEKARGIWPLPMLESAFLKPGTVTLGFEKM